MHSYKNLYLLILDSGINVVSGINAATGKFDKKNKRSPISTLHLNYQNRLNGVCNIALSSGKKSKN